MRVDFHVHTDHGVGKNTPAEMAAIAKKRGLHAIAITDLGVLKGWKQFKPKNFVIIPGLEVLTTEGRVLIYGPDELPEHRSLDHIIRWAKRKDYLVVPSHFNDESRGSLGDKALKLFKVVEAINGTTSPGVCKDAVMKCTSAGVKFMCNSGARSVSGLGDFYNNVKIKTDSWEEIIREVKKGNFEPRIKFPGLADQIRHRFKL
ncbi:MAG: PHP domain-containing protein [Candidatus Altiarchaeota archaeon]|nr:PHP domain-containing protein [Candidatus Altiarchaeota archaeon]